MPPIARRDLLKAAAGLVPLMVARGADAAAITFDHGVASGDPQADAVILWTRVTPPSPDIGPVLVSWKIARDALLGDVAASGATIASADTDYTVKVDARGLQPGRGYWYQFSVGDTRSAIGRTRTAPVGQVTQLRLAFVTCSHYGRGFYNVYKRIAARDDLQAVVHLGDTIYEDGEQNGVRPQRPARELLTLADYRTRHATTRSDPDLQAMHARHPMIWVWDDHEVANNAWRGGAAAHDPATEGDYAQRRAAAFRAAHEWMPIRTPDPANLSIIYRPFAFGDLADLLMLDTRHVARDQQVPPNGIFGKGKLPVFRQTGAFTDASRQMLGAEQERWLAERVYGSTARWRILGNQVILSPLKLLGLPRASKLSLHMSNDSWDGYEPARDRLLEVIGKTRNVVVMTGDAHEAYAFDITPDPNNLLAYNGVSGRGSLGVEFVVTSTTTRGDKTIGTSLSAIIDNAGDSAQTLLPLSNPHLKYFENRRNGYVLLDVTPERVLGEFWFVPKVGVRSDEETRGATFVCDDGSAKLRRL